ncbi:GntR family transcriptional regulator [Lacticaseibacillus daqingensis]|uniref:GntR family transcriptional regulator n=1 Tax=Lacticaseibacillus daqingensis TaxID=2486014 RepID=UPI000F79F5F6|nr:GntR family transcriptional regulator [Lacticaseibacillus daqingensis]
MEFDDKVPIYYQIEEYIRQQIISGQLAAGAQVPAVRQLALDLTVNVNTIQRALSHLVQTGVLVSKRGLGNFVTTDAHVLAALRTAAIQAPLAQLYDRLAALNLTADEMRAALETYIAQREKESE